MKLSIGPQLLLLCQLLFPFILAERKYKLCVGEKMAKFNQKAVCQQLNENEYSGAECVIARDRLECLRLLNASAVDFTVLHPEDLVFAKTMAVPVRVTHELQKFKNVPSVDYSVVGLVSYRISIESLADLRNSKMCSVGFDVENGHDFDWNEIFSKFIEDQVISDQRCDLNLSLSENRIASLENYFGDSCKAGKWLPDPKQDQLLKQKYPGLCALCDNPAQCSLKDKYWGRRGVAYCMTDCLGDVAWMRLDDWRMHEKTTPNKLCSDFFFLCPDGTVQLSSSPSPCSWVSQPLPTIGVRGDLPTTLTHFISEIGTSLPSAQANISWQWATRNLLSPYSRYIVPLENEFTPNYYLAKANNYLAAAEDESGCDNSHHVIRFCAEAGPPRAKCEAMGAIARAYGVAPEIECRSPDRKAVANCEKMLEGGGADVMSVGTDDYADALRSNPKLKPILYQLGDQHRYAVAVVKKSSRISSFAQLRGKNACFGMVGDLGWNAVIYQLLKERLLPPICPYEEALKQFFNGVCAIYSPDPSVIRQCDESIHRERNMAYEQVEVMECLAEGGGDVVFIDLRNINARMEHEWFFKSSNYAFQTLCPPGVIRGHASATSNTSCSLLWASQGQILIPASTGPERAQEIANTLRQIAAYFGEKVKTLGTPAESLKLFGAFDQAENVLFQDETRAFASKEFLLGGGSKERLAGRSYEHVLPLFSTCDPAKNLVAPDSGSLAGPSLAGVMVLAVVLMAGAKSMSCHYSPHVILPGT